MARHLSFALALALAFVACGRVRRDLPVNDDAVLAGRAGAAKHDAIAGSSGDRGGAPGREPSSEGGASAGSEGIVAAVGGAGAGNETLPDAAGAGGRVDGVVVQPWDPRVPPEVLPLEGDGALTGIWYGPVGLSVPGFYAPPVDHLTVALDDSGLRSVAFQQFFRTLSVTGGEVTTPALDNGRHFPVEVAAVSATAFELRYTASAPAEGVDYVESVQGELRDGELAVTYFVRGALDNLSSIDGLATGLLHRVGSPRTPSATLSGTWYDEVSLSAPGFVGPPRDQLTLAFDVEGRLKHLYFAVFTMLPLTFGESESEFPLLELRCRGSQGELYAVELRPRAPHSQPRRQYAVHGCDRVRDGYAERCRPARELRHGRHALSVPGGCPRRGHLAAVTSGGSPQRRNTSRWANNAEEKAIGCIASAVPAVALGQVASTAEVLDTLKGPSWLSHGSRRVASASRASV